jgi:hypothetical protein
MAKDLSTHEYTIKNHAFTAISVTNGARFAFSNRVSEAAPDPGESAAVGQGSGPDPVYHLETVKEPKCSLTIPVDEAQRFKKWFRVNCAATKTCNLEIRRSKPGVAPVVDLMGDWKPVWGAQTIGTDANMVPVSGNALSSREDITNVLQP